MWYIHTRTHTHPHTHNERSVQFCYSVVSDYLWPRGPQHARLPCPSPTPRAYSNSCPSSQWCHPTITTSVIPFSSHLQSFPASGSFPMSQFCTSGGQSIGVSASASFLPMILKLNIQKTKIMASDPIISWQIDGGTVETVADFIFLGCKITVDSDCSHEIKRCLLFGRKVRQHIKKQRHYFANKGPSSQSYGFSSSHVWMWELDYKESRVPKNWCFWTVVMETTLESPLDCKEIQPVHPKGDQS